MRGAPVRVACVTASVSRLAGGIFAATHGLASALQSTGEAEVHVLSGSDSATERDLALWAGLPVTACRTYGPANFAFSPALHRRLDTAQPDVLHTHGLW